MADANADAAATEASAKNPATPEGLALTYGWILILALIPIFIGAFRSVTTQEEDRISVWKATMVPIYLSCSLFALYTYLQFFNNEYVNLFISFCFLVKGFIDLTHMMAPVVAKLIPRRRFALILTMGGGEMMTIASSTHNLLALTLSTLVGIWYFMTKHWMANNILCIVMAVRIIELKQLNNVKAGCILLGGLFIFDIVMVFGCDVMITVAKSIEIPILLRFPVDLLENGFDAKNMVTLGLGDVTFAGLFLALMLRYDNSLQPNSSFYFVTTLVGYIAGFLLSFIFVCWYHHPQPAQLYLVPLCIGAPIIMAYFRGNLQPMLEYSDVQ